jgi:hypothetical protein
MTKMDFEQFEGSGVKEAFQLPEAKVSRTDY